MVHDFGEILDCRDVPSISHYIIILGSDKKQTEYYYTIITSQVYEAFAGFVKFLTGCKNCNGKVCPWFKSNFTKEKGDEPVPHIYNLKDVHFLPKQEYNFLTDDSMVPINKDLTRLSADTLQEWHKNGWGSYIDTLKSEDIRKIVTLINVSPYVGRGIRRAINRTSTEKLTKISCK